MKFCQICQNVLNERLINDDLVNVCKICSYTEKIDNYEIDNVSIIESNCQDYNKINTDICHDITYPKKNNINCIDNNCNGKEIMYVVCKDSMKYIYICCKCKISWS